MREKKKWLIRTLMNHTKAAVMVLFFLGLTGPFMSCADLREEFDSSKWRYQPVPNLPPSWENDMGRPDMSGGETPFE